MNIESTNLSSVVQSSGMVENVSATPRIDGVVVSEGFSEALVAQIELLSNMKAEESLPLQTPDQVVLPSVSSSPGVVELPVVKTNTQDFAALLGNDLPPTYKTKDDVDHEAALAAVTDTLKYIALGTSAGEKAAEAEQNIKDVIAMAVPSQQSVKDMAATVIPVQQKIKDEVVAVVPVRQEAKDVVVTVAPTQQEIKDVVPMFIPATEQNAQDVVEKAVPVEQVKEVVVAVTEQNMANAPVQTDSEQSKEKPDKQSEGQSQIVTVSDDNQGAEDLPAGAILPPVIPIEQVKIVNNLAPSNAIQEEALSFINPAIIKSSTENAKSSQATKVSGNIPQGEAVLRQPGQSNQDFSVKYSANAGQSEKAGQFEPQVLNVAVDGEETLPRIGTETIQPAKPVVDNKVDVKADVPAISKPLSHPEWNKDIGERIVWMSNKAIPSAEIRLNPQHLGPISVRVDVTDDKATVAFTAQHAVVRETLEASIPKLREMMSAQQIDLVEVNVSQGSASDQGRSQAQNFAQTSGRGQGMVDGVIDGIDDIEQEIESGRAVVSKGLLSLYA